MSHLFSTICPHCGDEHDMASGITKIGTRIEPYPDDGSASLCMRCGNFNIFDQHKSGGLRRPTKQELRDLSGDPKVQVLMQAWQDVMQKRQS